MKHLSNSQIELGTREIAVLRELVRARTFKRIAGQLDIETATVKSYVGALCAELGLATRAELTTWAFQHPEALRGQPVDPAPHTPDCACDGPYCSIVNPPRFQLVWVQPKAA